MSRIVLYIAQSLDGFIATSDGGVGWLDAFQKEDYGYDAFLEGIGTIVMGRTTYDQVLGFGEWPYAGHRTIVLTHRPLEAHPPGGVEAFAGPLEPLISQLRAEPGGDVWNVGGERAIRSFLELGGIDALELFVMPVLLGTGVRLFGQRPLREPRQVGLVDSSSFPAGVVRLRYAFS